MFCSFFGRNYNMPIKKSKKAKDKPKLMVREIFICLVGTSVSGPKDLSTYTKHYLTINTSAKS